VDGAGTNFAVFSQSADSVDLCLFDAAGNETVYELPEVDAYVWHGYLEEAEPGQLYGYRVRGTYDPARGLRANHAKLLLDPYAKAVFGRGRLGARDLRLQVPQRRRRDDGRDRFGELYAEVGGRRHGPSKWPDDHKPRTPWHDTIIYETHVRGLTMRHPDVPPAHRGTYSGLAHPRDRRAFPAPGHHCRRADARPPVRPRPPSCTTRLA